MSGPRSGRANRPKRDVATRKRSGLAFLLLRRVWGTIYHNTIRVWLTVHEFGGYAIARRESVAHAIERVASADLRPEQAVELVGEQSVLCAGAFTV
jgi:hypothetical protein